MKSRFLVTGASGFIGSALVAQIFASGMVVTAVSRRQVGLPVSVVKLQSLSELEPIESAINDIDIVIHCAARVHVLDDQSENLLDEFKAVNVEGTLNLARLAASKGVRRFIFVSSIKVNGEQTDNRPPFTPDDQPEPVDPYGVSKREAEDGLRKIAGATGMELVIIRPPLVYGPGVKGNFRSLLKLASFPAPLPLGGIENRRSLVYLGNLVDFIIHIAQHPAAANQTFLVSDGQDLSTTELLRALRKAMGRPDWLIPIPGHWLWKVAVLAGMDAVGQRLCGSLQLNVSRNESLLGWRPPYTIEQGLEDTLAGVLRKPRGTVR